MPKEIEEIDLAAEDDENIRVSVPLHMLQGNMDVLLAGELPVEGIQLKHHDRGVILIVSGSPEQKEVWKQMGFRTTQGKLVSE